MLLRWREAVARHVMQPSIKASPVVRMCYACALIRWLKASLLEPCAFLGWLWAVCYANSASIPRTLLCDRKAVEHAFHRSLGVRHLMCRDTPYTLTRMRVGAGLQRSGRNRSEEAERLPLPLDSNLSYTMTGIQRQQQSEE